MFAKTMIIRFVGQLQKKIGKLNTLARYGFTTIIVFICWSFRFFLSDTLGDYPFLLFFPAIMLSGLLFNHGTSLYAVALSAALATYFFIPPMHSFTISTKEDGISLLLYLIIATLLALIIEALRHSVERLGKALKNLDIANEQLEKSNQQKAVMLDEVHHRIKNDLQLSMGILSIQSRSAPNSFSRKALEGAASRLSVLGHAYERLRLKDDINTAVNVHDFIEELCADLRSSHIALRPIALRTAIDKIEMESSRAVSLGLIVNELVINALKYAFPNDRTGDVTVTFKCDSVNCVLTVMDNGVGLHPVNDHKDTIEKTSGGFGRSIVRSLVQQLGGVMEVSGVQGVTYTITLPQ